MSEVSENAVEPGSSSRTAIVEPVTRYLTMELDGELTTCSRTFDTISAARLDGLKAACLRGAVNVTIKGDNGALLCSYQRADNIWRDLYRGKLVLTEDLQLCSCGGVPTAEVGHPAFGEWRWRCRRCGAASWSEVVPAPAGGPRPS